MSDELLQGDGQREDESRILKAVQSIAISPKDAKEYVAQIVTKAKLSNPTADEHKIQEIVAKQIVTRYSKLCAMSGGATALSGVIPGIGTAIAMVGGGLTDATISLKLQVDMTMCIAEAFGWDLTNEDARHMSFLIAACGALEKVGIREGTALASKAGVKMINQYLQGAALQTIKELFKKIGINFARTSLQKAIPFGVGVAIGSGVNYAFTKYVGNSAMKWFVIEREMKNQPDVISAAAESAVDLAGNSV